MEEAREKLREAGMHAQQAAGAAARGAMQQAQTMTTGLTEKAKEASGQAEDKTDKAISTVGEKMTALAGSLRAHAPHDGPMGSAASTVAEKLETGGQYLQESGVREITEDLAGVIRRHPIPALLAVFGVGFLIGMSARR
jgi:hypothetical protein